jgi:phosphoenolpyruvate-protein kinase (PTS system EI component)
MRGVRFLLENQDLLKTQMRALMHLFAGRNLRIMVPMVTTEEDIVRVRGILNAVANEVDAEELPPLGVMIEVPAAALCVADIARHTDFVSIGTNDLTQYVMAAGRENLQVDPYFVDDHPAIMKLIAMVLRGASGIPVSLCGEVAGREECISKLLEVGIDCISIAPPLIPGIKAHIKKYKRP